MQALLQGPPKPFTLPVEELEAAVARAAEHGEALEPSEVPASSDPGSGTPSLPRASRGATPVSRSAADACALQPSPVSAAPAAVMRHSCPGTAHKVCLHCCTQRASQPVSEWASAACSRCTLLSAVISPREVCEANIWAHIDVLLEPGWAVRSRPKRRLPRATCGKSLTGWRHLEAGTMRMTTALKTWILTPRVGHQAQLQVCFAHLLALHD